VDQVGPVAAHCPGSTLGFFLVAGYVLWRLKRYKTKYEAKKEQLEELQERARELDETSGGLGIADDEVDMVANPLVVQLASMEKQVAKIKEDIVKEADENKAIDDLEKERQRIYAEMERVKAALREAADRARAARVSVVSNDFPMATSVMNTSSPMGGASTGDEFTTSATRASAPSTVTAPPPTTRTDFTSGVKRPKKKDVD